MRRVTIVIRELGSAEPDCCLEFDLPEIPLVGSYITLRRPGGLEAEGLQVRRVWWKMAEVERIGSASAAGRAETIFVECGPANLPCSMESWKSSPERVVPHPPRLAYSLARGADRVS